MKKLKTLKARLFTKGIAFTSPDLKKVKLFLFPDENYNMDELIAIIETLIDNEQFVPLLGPRSTNKTINMELIETIFADGEIWDLDDYDYDDILLFNII